MLFRSKPSGAAVNPVTGELYILSSINKLLVVAERNGKIKEKIGNNILATIGIYSFISIRFSGTKRGLSVPLKKYKGSE